MALRLVLLASLFLAACAPTIGNKQDVRNASFMLGQSDKQEVMDVLGLPAEITHSEALGLEYWAYRDSPELTGIMIAMPTSGGTVQMDTIATGENTAYEFKDAAAIYIFDAEQKLIDVRYPN